LRSGFDLNDRNEELSDMKHLFKKVDLEEK